MALAASGMSWYAPPTQQPVETVGRLRHTPLTEYASCNQSMTGLEQAPQPCPSCLLSWCLPSLPTPCDLNPDLTCRLLDILEARWRVELMAASTRSAALASLRRPRPLAAVRYEPREPPASSPSPSEPYTAGTQAHTGFRVDLQHTQHTALSPCHSNLIRKKIVGLFLKDTRSYRA